MTAKANTQQPGRRRKLTLIYAATLFLLTLSGFAQMPIFKRYYIADVPGLGWLAEFYTTHFLHYLGAVAILAISAFFLAEHFLLYRRHRKITAAGMVKAGMLAGIMASGLLLVVRNSIFVSFSPAAVTVMLLVHMGLAVAFLLFALYCRIRGMSDVSNRQSEKI